MTALSLKPSSIVALILLALLLLIQYPLWFGKGGWLRVWELERQSAAQKQKNDELRKRNAAIEADVRDLKTGTLAVEERARQELNMVREGEVFVQIVGATQGAAASAVKPASAVATSAASVPSTTPSTRP